MDQESLAIAAAAVPIVVALVEVLKRTFTLDSRFGPGAAVVLGIAWVVGTAAARGEYEHISILIGVVAGLGASGLYSGVRAMRE